MSRNVGSVSPGCRSPGRSASPTPGDALEFLRVSAPKLVVHIIIAVVLIYLVKLVTSRLTKFTHRDVVSTSRAQQLRTAAGVINSVAVFVIVFMTLMQILATVHINM